ncbi:MAG: hypothetical protein Q4E54_07605 [Lachnospiraceae bacterium]|nr:hypothetical protein [Lachnospiraceae bacterium]
MDNVKKDAYYINKLKTDLAFISLHMSGKSSEDFDADEVLQDSMMFRLIQISENAKPMILSAIICKCNEARIWRRENERIARFEADSACQDVSF